MTAVNLIVGRAATFLITDTAAIDAQGRLRQSKSKVITSPRLRIAIAHNGTCTDESLAPFEILLSAETSQAEAMRRLPEAARASAKLNRDHFRDPLADRNGWTDPVQNFFMAVWSVDREQAEGYVLTAERNRFMPDRVQPLRLHPAQRFVAPEVSSDVQPGADFNGEKSAALRLVDQQRRTGDEFGRYIVGGAVELTRVDGNGVEVTQLRSWRRDKIGRRLTPSLLDRFF